MTFRDQPHRRVGLLTLGSSAVKLTQVVIALSLARVVSPDNWNAIALALSIYLAAVTLGSLNLQQSLVFFLPLIPRDQHWHLVRRTARLLGAVGLVIAAMLHTARPILSGRAGMPGVGLSLVGLAVALELPTVCAPALFVARDQLGWGAVWDVGLSALQIVAMVLPAISGGGVIGVLGGLVVASSARVFLFVLLLRVARRSGHVRSETGLLRRQLKFCTPLGISMAATVMARSVDKWLVAWLDPSKTGVYVLAAQELPIVAVLPYAGGAAVVVELVRRISTGDRFGAGQMWRAQAASMSMVVVPVTAAITVCAPEAFPLVFGRTFASGVLPFQFFTLIGAHRVIEYGMVLRAADRGTALVRASAVLLGANVVLGLLGGLAWGANGVAFGCLLAFTIAWLQILRQIAVVFETSWTDVFPWRRWLSVSAASLGAAALAIGVASTAESITVRLTLKASCLTLYWLIAGQMRGRITRRARTVSASVAVS